MTRRSEAVGRTCTNAAEGANDFQPKPAKNDNAFMLKVVDGLERGSASQKALGGVIRCALFTLNQAAASTAPGRMEPVTRDFRNRALTQRNMQSPDDRISISCGAAHLPGQVAELRKRHPKWAIGSVEWLRTIESPEHIEGHLRGLGN